MYVLFISNFINYQLVHMVRVFHFCLVTLFGDKPEYDEMHVKHNPVLRNQSNGNGNIYCAQE